MTISPCSSSNSVAAIQSQASKNQTKSTETTKQEQPQDTVQLSAQALNQLKGIDTDGDGY
jgi:anti-sigma28 factor (negative regulator of flagellin synthesis)